MLEKQNRKKFFRRIKWFLLAAALVVFIRTLWLLPRTNWSLKGSSRTSFTLENAPRTELSPSDVRNVLLISIDTCRADHLSCYGYSRPTSPNIDALASESILFSHTVSPIPITLPAHSSMLTGTTPLYHKVRDNSSYRLSESNVTLAEILRRNGYVTGAVVGAFVLDSRFGLDQGFGTYNDSLGEDKPKDKEKSLFSINECSAERVTHVANQWLEKHYKNKFFLFLHYFDPHDPYVPHKAFSFRPFPFTLSIKKDYYDSEIAYTDHYIGQVIKKLKDLNLYESTLLIITSDHGEGLGQHYENSHSHFIYHTTIHVPLIMKVPSGPEGIIINDTVGLIDIVPTVCGFLNIPVPQHVQGKDLSSFFAGKKYSTEKRFLYCESLMATKFDMGPLVGLISDHWKYIHALEPELYNLRRDPHETKSLFDSKNQQARLMQKQLKLILQEDFQSDVADNEVSIDQESRNRLQSLGYISGPIADGKIQFDKSFLDMKKFTDLHKYVEKVLTLIAANKNEEAKKVCKKMLAKWPDSKRIHYYAGIISKAQGDNQAVINHFSQFLKNDHTKTDSTNLKVVAKNEFFIAHFDLGLAFFGEKQNPQAIEHFKKALSYYPMDREANFNLAGSYFVLGDLINAALYYQKTLELDPDISEAHYYLGCILLKHKKFNQAIERLENAIALKPEWDKPREKLQFAKDRIRTSSFPR